MRILLSILIAFIFLNSCKKESAPSQDGWFIIQIQSQKDINCGYPVISFTTGIEEAKNILNSNTNTYVALNLPKVNYAVGQQLNVKIKKPDPGIACITLGPTYPQVEITDIK